MTFYAAGVFGRPLIAVFQVLIAACSIALCLWGGLIATPIILGLFVFTLVVLVRGGFAAAGLQAVAWVVLILANAVLLVEAALFSLDFIHVPIPWLQALSLYLIHRGQVAPGQRWVKMAFFCAFFGSLLLLGVGYLQNHSVAFYCASVLLFGLCILVQRRCTIPFWTAQVLNTAILLVVCLPVFDFVVGPKRTGATEINVADKPYSYDGAGRDPNVFRQWWMYYIDEMHSMQRSVCMEDPSRDRPFLLKPNSRGKLFGAPVVINGHGFRGNEVPSEKRNEFRIVALGESTTFGLNLGGVPWPEILEKLLTEEFKAGRRVRVINAGVPAYTLGHNVARFEREILPLQPDLVISYHGVNGFGYLDHTIPPNRGEPPPPYIARPLRIVADFEYRMKLLRYSRKIHQESTNRDSTGLDVMQSEYAQLYEQLFEQCRNNGVRLMLSSFSMAVNEASRPELKEFYRPGHPSVYKQIRANRLHTELVRKLASTYPEIGFIDTNPQLDGEHSKFIDLVHFHPDGEAQIARTMFEALKDTLQEHLNQD